MFQEQMIRMQERHEAQIQDILVKTTMSVHLPSFISFDSSKELWRDYWARFTTFAAAQSIPEEKISHVFLISQDPSIYKLLNTLANQENPARELNTLTMEEIVIYMEDQFHPKLFVVIERYKFWSEMSSKPGENVPELAARIRQEGITCDFTSIKNPQDEAMGTKFICSTKMKPC